MPGVLRQACRGRRGLVPGSRAPWRWLGPAERALGGFQRGLLLAGVVGPLRKLPMPPGVVGTLSEDLLHLGHRGRDIPERSGDPGLTPAQRDGRRVAEVGWTAGGQRDGAVAEPGGDLGP